MSDNYIHAPCLYFAVRGDGCLTEVNETLCRCLGYTREELLHRKVELIFTLATRIFQETHLFPLLKMQGHAEEIYISLKARDKRSIPVLINAVYHFSGDESKTVYAGIVVENRKKFEDELVAAKKAAEQALQENTALVQAKKALQEHMELLDRQMVVTNKQNEELRQFNHVVTHELQEPLRKLFLYLMMVDENNGVEANAKAIAKIKPVAEQMRTTLSGLQQYVWLTETTVKSELIDLNLLIEEVVDILRSEYADVPVKLSAEDLPAVAADREQIRYLFYELFRNAIQFRKQNEWVLLTITGREVQVNKFRKMPDKYHFTRFLKIEIKDNGMGINRAYKEQAFTLFKRLHAASGSGIGLSLCRKIVENHEGSIVLDSQEGEGTTVILQLPLLENTGIPDNPFETTNLNLPTRNDQ